MSILSPDEEAPRAYDAYGSVTDHKNYQGLPMPKWEDLPEKIQQAWKAASKCIIDRATERAQEFYRTIKD